MDAEKRLPNSPSDSPGGGFLSGLRTRALANFRYRRTIRQVARGLVTRLGVTGALAEAANVRARSQIPEVRIFAFNLEREIRDTAPANELLDVRSLGWRAARGVFAPGRASGRPLRNHAASVDVELTLKRFRQAQLSPDSPLTDRQMECLEWAALGKSSADIAGILDLSKRTVDDHLRVVCERLEVKNRVQAVGKLVKIRDLDETP